MDCNWRVAISVTLTIAGTICWFGTPIVEYFTRHKIEPHNRISKIKGHHRVSTAIGGAWKSSVPDTVLVSGVTLIVTGLLLPYAHTIFVIIIPMFTFAVLWIVRCIAVFPKYIHEVRKDEWRKGLLTMRYWLYLLPSISFFVKKDR